MQDIITYTEYNNNNNNNDNNNNNNNQWNSHYSVAKLPYNHVRDICFYAVAVWRWGKKRQFGRKKTEADS